ncbi:MAG: hypothetical protein GYB64_17590 [Chloroflexi bacterium]|nr:hypothetical protein [Chloroflexota bacterium]
MTATLRDVLTTFEEAGGSLTVAQMSRRLNTPPALLEDMLTFWVRKGRIREVGFANSCHMCHSAPGCPFIATMPRTYELVTGTDPDPPPCTCGTCH